ncbi:MAG: redox-sensing transcriptional repressor Rex [Oscillospiraceae bacterium]|nr:redox-sensing transcriptional repressor Rex [Oscillospiraceae bacterium]
MNKKENISNSVIRRLPRYYRFLRDLKENGISRTSSSELSQQMGLTASQIRQDLNCFGEFGQQGYGYNVDYLYSEICRILDLSRKSRAILIGAGNLGKAIAFHMDFENSGFRLIGVFDRNENVIGRQLLNLEVKSMDGLKAFCGEKRPEAAFLCIPKESAGKLAEDLIRYGVKAFWNFSHYDFGLSHPGVAVENVYLSDSLMTLSYQLKEAAK